MSFRVSYRTVQSGQAHTITENSTGPCAIHITKRMLGERQERKWSHEIKKNEITKQIEEGKKRAIRKEEHNLHFKNKHMQVTYAVLVWMSFVFNVYV